MMDPRSRPLPPSSGYALADLPVEAPLDALAPGDSPAAARAAMRPAAASPAPAQAHGEELVDPEKILLGEHLHAEKPAAQSAPSATPSMRAPLPTGSPVPAATTTAPLVTPTPTGASPAASPPAASPASTGGAPPPAQRGPELMDRDFIARNQVVERYLSGRLPIKGATDFERFCRENPELLDELGLPERVNAALRLLEASGKPEPWAEPRKPFWQRLEILLGLLGAVLVLAIGLAIVASGSSQKTRVIAALRQEATERPLDPATSTRDIRLLPSREGASDSPAIIIGGGSEAQLADFRIDESRSPYRLFRITIDRINQGRVGIIDHLAKDSDGNLRIALNSTALGPGDYQLTIEGLSWQGAPQPDSWVTIGVRATQ